MGGAVVNLPKGGTAGVQPSVWLTCWVAQRVVHLLGVLPSAYAWGCCPAYGASPARLSWQTFGWGWWGLVLGALLVRLLMLVWGGCR